MPENQTTKAWAADKDRPWGRKKPDITVKIDLQERYGRIGIPAVAAATRSGQDRKDGGR